MPIGWPELVVIMVVGLFVFGPEKLPKVIGDGVRLVRQLRAQAAALTSDLKSEIGPELGELRSLDPRAALDDDPQPRAAGAPRSPQRPQQVPLRAGERPPFDPDAT